MEAIELTIEELIDRARTMTKHGRKILGITGAPGAGKSTISKAIISTLGRDLAAFAPMDGFHLSNATLIAENKLERKGAIDTFDVDGYLHLLRRLRAAEEEVVHAPDYYRSFEESIGSAIPIYRQIPLVVTEGNYLLATEGGWEKVSGLLDECWFIDLAEDVRIERLIKRHIEVGKSQADAEKWSRGSDQKNAEAIFSLRDRADFLITVSK
jgi:pantothenate kinase